MHTHVTCMYTYCVCMYIYIEREIERERESKRDMTLECRLACLRRATMWSYRSTGIRDTAEQSELRFGVQVV